MAIGDFLDNPLDAMFDPFTNMFRYLINDQAGQVFWLFPIIVLTYAVHIKVKNTAVTSLFMIGTGASLASGGLFVGASAMAGVFIIFAALGFVSLFMNIYFQR